METNAANNDEPEARESKKPKRRWYQYSLRTLLLFMTLVACGFGWLGVKVQKARRQKAAVEALVKLGAWVQFDYGCDANGDDQGAPDIPGPEWLRSIVGDDYFRTVRTVLVLPKIKTADAVPFVREFTQLESLQSFHTDLTDSGLEQLQNLRHLKELKINGTDVTDAGLEYLKGMAELKYVNVHWTSVTDKGVEALQRALPDCTISYKKTTRYSLR